MDHNLGKEKQSESTKKTENHQENQQEPKVADGSSQTPDFRDGKLLVKLRFPKPAQEIEKDEFVHGPAGKSHLTHFCQECSKGFSSGKALGGHMSSAHVQAKDYLKKLKLNKSTKFKRDGSSSGAGTSKNMSTLCPVCEKSFASMKSLYGHMRCHPDRNWRGMEPPTEPHAISEPSEFLPDDDDDVDVDDNGYDDDIHDPVDSAARVMYTGVLDLTRSLSRWGVRGKRGRDGLKRFIRDPPLLDDEEKKLYDAVNQLIRLVNEDPNDPMKEDRIVEEDKVMIGDFSTPNSDIKNVNGGFGSKEQRVEVNTARDKRDFPLKKRKFGATANHDSEKTLDGASDLGKGKAPIEPEFSNDKLLGSQFKDVGLSTVSYNNDFSADLDLKSMKTELQNHKKRGQKATPMGSRTEGEITPPMVKKIDSSLKVTPEKFKCSTCDKCFPSHQALGGHRSSHNKLRVNIQNTADGSYPFAVSHEIHASSSSQLLKSNENGGVDGSMVVENIHQCQTCKKIFPTGQALGGHKRCHWPVPSNQVAASEDEEEETGMADRKVLDFDLNCEPPETEDGNANG